MSNSSAERNPVDRLAEEFAARFRRGERPSLTEYTQRYPELAQDIRELFPALVLMEQLKPPADATGPEGAAAAGTRLQALGDYRILREVGRGGMGVVYEAEQVSLGRHVALKVLAGPALVNPTSLERFRREAKAAAKLHHTNIVPVYGVGEHAGVHYYAMQYIAGEGLDRVLHDVRRLRRAGAVASDDLVATAGTACAASIALSLVSGTFTAPAAAPEAGTGDPAPLPRLRPSPGMLSGDAPGTGYYRGAARMALQVAEALAYAHRQGVLHRDIKPSNLLLDAQGTVWVTDFGLAKAEGTDELTQTGDIVGTVRYMAPERFDGHSLPQSDVYGLGLTLYELLTLRPAFDDTNRARLIERLLHERPVPPRKLDPRIPRDLETVVLKCLAREPAGRYASADALAEDLRRFLADRPVRARRTPWHEETWRWCRRNPAVAALLGVIALLLAAMMVGTLAANARLRSSLRDAQDANQKANARLWESLRDRARAGQRVEALRSIREAAALPLPPGHSRDELRTEAIEALAVPDVEIETEWNCPPPGPKQLAFDAHLERYARIARDGTVNLCRIAGDAELARWKEEGFDPYPGYPAQLTLSPDGRHVAIYHDGRHQLRVRRVDGGQAVLLCDVGGVTGVGAGVFSPDGTRLVYVRQDGTVVVLDLATVAPRPLQERLTEPSWLCVHPDGRQFAVVTRVKGQWGVEVRDLTTGALRARLLHPARVTSPAWHPDGQTLATLCDDRRIRLWDVPGGRQCRAFEVSNTGGGTLAFDQHSGLLLSNDWGGALRVWEPSSGRQLMAFPAGWSPFLYNRADGVLPMFKQNGDTKLRLLRLHPPRAYRSLTHPQAGADGGFGERAPVFGADGGLLFAMTSGRPPAGISVLDAANGSELTRIPLANEVPFHWGPGGELLTWGRSGVLRWPAAADRDRPGHHRFGPPQSLLKGQIQCPCDSSPDGQTIAVPLFGKGALVLHRDRPGRPVALGPQQDVRSAAVSPDGRWVATGSHTSDDACAVRVWDARTGRLVQSLPVPGPCGVAFGPDGRWLLTTSGGGRLWRAGTWEEGPGLGGRTACFAPDGRSLAVEGEGGAIRLVEADSGGELARLGGPVHTPVRPLCFSPDGTRLVALAVETRTLVEWDLRALRQDLQALGLDWDAPPYPAAPAGGTLPPLSADVELGNVVQRAEADRLTEQGRDHARSGRAAEAVAALRQALRTDPTHAAAHNALAWLLLTGPKPVRDPGEALTLARKAVELAPESPPCLNTLGLALYRADRPAEAVPLLEKSLAAGEGRHEAYDLFFLAMCHARLGDAARARDCFDRAVHTWEGRKDLTGRFAEELTAFRAEAEAVLSAR
jgi:serine/threonine protein kinase/WD40 repeat protein